MAVMTVEIWIQINATIYNQFPFPLDFRRDEKEPLRTPTGSIKQNSTIEFDGRFVHSRSGEIIGKNSAV